MCGNRTRLPPAATLRLDARRTVRGGNLKRLDLHLPRPLWFYRPLSPLKHLRTDQPIS